MKKLQKDLSALVGRPCESWRIPYWYLVHPGFKAVCHYRLANWLWHKGLRFVANLVKCRSLRLTAAEILPSAEIAEGLVITHPVGLVIGARAVIGKGCRIMQGVTIGERISSKTTNEYPRVGDNVVICAGAAILGGIQVGDAVVVGAHAVVLADVPAGLTVVGAPARRVT